MYIYEKLFNIKKYIKKIYLYILPDRFFLQIKYKEKVGKKLNLKRPVTYTEKINWLKLYDRKNEYSRMVDKYEVRKYVADVIGEEYLVPLIGCWDKVEQIDFESLPNKFVLKCNHDNGVIICNDKQSIDLENVKKTLYEHLQRNLYKAGREWAYKNVKRKIICEKYLEDKSDNGLIDYKFFCFNGKAKAVLIVTNRATNPKFDFYDRYFNHLPITNGYPNSEVEIEKPNNFETMIQLAQKLSKGIVAVRVDLYNLEGKIYFGEMTFYHNAGFVPLEPEEWEKEFGNWIELPRRKNFRKGIRNGKGNKSTLGY